MNCENDDLEEDAENVGCQTEENRILTLRKCNAPNEAAEEHQIVDQVGLKEKTS